jgi:hypothetical protein
MYFIYFYRKNSETCCNCFKEGGGDEGEKW